MDKAVLVQAEGTTTRRSFGVSLGAVEEASVPLIKKIDLDNFHNPNDLVYPYFALGSKVAFVETTTVTNRRTGHSETYVSGFLPASGSIQSCYCDSCSDCFGCFINYAVCCCRYQIACKPCAKPELRPNCTCECLKYPILGIRSYSSCCCVDLRDEVNICSAGADLESLPCMSNCCGWTCCYNCNECKCMCCKSLHYIHEN